MYISDICKQCTIWGWDDSVIDLPTCSCLFHIANYLFSLLYSLHPQFQIRQCMMVFHTSFPFHEPNVYMKMIFINEHSS